MHIVELTRYNLPTNDCVIEGLTDWLTDRLIDQLID